MELIITRNSEATMPETARGKWELVWENVDKAIAAQEVLPVEINVGDEESARSLASNGGTKYRNRCKVARKGSDVFFRVILADSTDELADSTDEEEG